MRKYSKLLVLIAGILLTAGVIICTACFFVVGFDFSKLSTTEQPIPAGTSFSINGNENVILTLTTESVNVRQSPDENIHINYYTTDRMDFALQQTDETINFTQIDNADASNWFGYLEFTLNTIDTTVIVEIPENFRGNLTIESSTGNVDIGACDCYIETLDAKTNTGDIKVADIKPANSSLKTTTGSIEAYGLITTNAVSMQTTTGSIELDNSICFRDITCNTMSGDIQLISVESDNLTINSTTGCMCVNSLECNSIKLQSTTGDISGSVVGTGNDYTVTSSTMTGENSLDWHNDRGSKNLDVSTTTGDIDIQFQQ